MKPKGGEDEVSPFPYDDCFGSRSEPGVSNVTPSLA